MNSDTPFLAPLIGEPARSAPPRKQVAFLLTAFVGMMVYVVIAVALQGTSAYSAVVQAFASVIGGGAALIVVGLAMLGVFVVLALVSARLVSGLRIRDVALHRAPLVATILSCLLAWPLYVLFYGLAATLSGTAQVNQAWIDASIIDRIGIALQPILINAFPEEVVYRAVILGLAFELFRRRLPAIPALVLAVVVSTVMFGIQHIPIGILNGRVLASAVEFLPAGIADALLYLIAWNIYLVGVVHGLGNSSANSVASVMPVVSDAVPYEPLLFAAAFAAAIPLWIARRRRARSLAESDGALAPADPAAAR